MVSHAESLVYDALPAVRYCNGRVPPYIQVRDLAKIYPSGKAELVVFSGLNLDVHSGEMLALVGESGAGKSTLLHLLGGLDAPSKGTIYYESTEISGLADWEKADFRSRKIGFVWQIHYLLPEFTALENVMMPLLIRGWSQGKAASESLARLDEVGLRARASHRAGELSGGEQQRVVLARALVGRPAVLLADEPTGNLDFRTGEMIFDLLEDLHRTHSLTSVLVTHNLSFARRCHRIISLEKGGLVPVPAGAPSGIEPEYL
jgi:lipoprotein-releasing system ATP-binding protein